MEAEREIEPGTVLAGRYRIERRLGKGGMGVVYEAEHVTLRRKVALKVLRPRFAENPEIVARFMQEARAAAAIGHPGIVETFDLSETEHGPSFLAMELLSGEELAVRIARDHPLEVSLVVRIGIEICEAIQAAHDRGIVHRDLKPQNVFLATQGKRRDVVKVLDFGIAKLTEGPRDASLTDTGQVLGTPLYMAPEQLGGKKKIDARTDVYAIGAILYQALAGRPPFTGETYPELILKITQETPSPLEAARSDLAPALAAIVRRAMHRDRDERYASAAALGKALEELSRGLAPEVESGTPRPVQSLSATAPSSRGASSEERDQIALAPTSPSSSLSDTPFASESHRPAHAGARLRIYALAGAVALGALVLALIDPWGDERPSERHGAQVRDRSEPAPAALVSPPLPVTNEGAATSDDVAPEPPPRVRAVLFRSTPEGARVSIGGAECITPCTLELEEGAASARVERRGYPARVVEPPFDDEVAVELERARTTGTDELPPLRPR
jgi:serine/threonine-protein kinase